MTRRHALAVAVSLAAMLIALVPPLWVRTTGDEVTLALRPVDPLSLFRGNYVDLRYDVDASPGFDTSEGDTVFVVFDGSRPAGVVDVTRDRPTVGDDQRCIRARADGTGGVDFPELEQFFVTPEEGAVLEDRLDQMVGVIRATRSCRAVLVAIEPENRAG